MLSQESGTDIKTPGLSGVRGASQVMPGTEMGDENRGTSGEDNHKS